MRWAMPEEALALADIHVSSWQAAYRGILPDSFLANLDREARARWWRRFLSDGALVHVADSAGDLVGFCHAGESDESGWGEVFSIYVHPSHWGRGHGRALLGAAESSLGHDGHDRALLWVLEANSRGRRFYESCGWQLGKPFRVEEIGGAQVTELRYERDLRGAT